MDAQLLILTAGHIVSAVMLYGLGIFVLLKNPKSDVNRAFFRLTILTAFFDTYFAIAVNLDPSALSYWVWFLNISIVYLMAAYPDFMLRALGKEVEYRWFIRLVYAVGTVILAIALIFPHLFLPQVEPKLYLKSYLDGGPLYAILLFFYLTFPVVPFWVLLKTYLTGEAKNKLQAEYFIVTSAVGFGIGCMSFFLVFDVPVDPMWGMFVGFYTIPIAYGIVASNLLDIRIVFKRAFFYAIGIGLLAGVLVVLTLLNNLLIAQVPWIQFWTVPVFTAIVAFILGRIFWRQSQEADRLKYEFITVAAHKLRTPLTRIRWEISAIQEKATEPEVAESLKHIDESNNRLIELTNVLLEAAHTEDVSYWYRKEQVDLAQAVKDASTRFVSLFKEKGITITTDLPETPLPVIGDRERLVSAIEVFIENASIYTPESGRVHIALRDEHRHATFSVQDTGIGVSPEDREHIFTRFFRMDAAKRADTEGVGLGLAMAKSIIEKHRGRLGVISAGEGKGATFWFSLPK